jgi:hypothetical protein
MNELKNDSVFVLKVIIILARFFMFFFSKTGTFLTLLITTFISCLIIHYAGNTPFWNLFMIAVVIGAVLFELAYPIVFNHLNPYFLEMKNEYTAATKELERRKNVNN